MWVIYTPTTALYNGACIQGSTMRQQYHVKDYQLTVVVDGISLMMIAIMMMMTMMMMMMMMVMVMVQAPANGRINKHGDKEEKRYIYDIICYELLECIANFSGYFYLFNSFC